MSVLMGARAVAAVMLGLIGVAIVALSDVVVAAAIAAVASVLAAALGVVGIVLSSRLRRQIDTGAEAPTIGESAAIAAAAVGRAEEGLERVEQGLGDAVDRITRVEEQVLAFSWRVDRAEIVGREAAGVARELSERLERLETGKGERDGE